MMAADRFTPNNNKPVIRLLAREFGKCNRSRNRILMGAVSLCIVTLTMVFGISYGKLKAEYTKSVRAAGTTASVRIEEADQSQYRKAETLGYVKQIGRCVPVGEAASGGERVCSIQVLDASGWEEMVKPAYTDISGHYPEEKQEIMLSAEVLKEMGVTKPEKGLKVKLTVSIGWFEKKEETFVLSGWYTGYVDAQKKSEIGYISEEKYKDWGYEIEEKADILICQSDGMDWQETEKRLYQDLSGSDSELKITAYNTFAYDAVNQMLGSYGMAVLGVLVVLSAVFFLIYNVMQISMAGDIRQMGLLNMLGAAKKQICGIYLSQIRSSLILGVLAGAFLSAVILLLVLPKILGSQYLSIYGGAKELRIFRPEILAASIVFAVLLTAGASAGVIYRTVTISCVESANYTSLRAGKKRGKKDKVRVKYKRRSAGGELRYMARQNLTRFPGRFLLTIFSLFLGMEMFLGTVVIVRGSDYIHAIEKRPDFLIAREFSDWGQEEGYGNEYKSRDAGEDPMETEGDNFCLLYGNEYDEFQPVPYEVRERLLDIPGVKRETSYVMEGAYMISTISREGIRPLCDEFSENTPVKDGVGYGCDYTMVEGFDADVIQILSDEEMNELTQYVKGNNLPVDIESLKNGTGVVILHDHQLSPDQEQAAEKSVGGPVYFTTMWSKEDFISWNSLSQEERDAVEDEERPKGKQSELFILSGYLDNRAEGFPHIRQTWHGAEGSLYYLISEKGFEKLPTEKKTLYMELDVEEKSESRIKAEVHTVLSQENQKKAELFGTGDDENGEPAYFCISKSDLLTEASSYIGGTRTILGSISIVLIFCGLMNYFNVMIMGILSRRKELEIMRNVGMTRRQERKLLAIEGLYYCLIEAVLMLTAGSVILKLIGMYMEMKLSYFVFQYPAGWTAVIIGCLAGLCFVVPEMLCRSA